MHSNVTSKNVSWLHFSWTTLYIHLGLLCKLHEIWSTDSQESHSNCCHEMSHFKAKNAPNLISAAALPQTLLGELTALPQTP